MPSLILTTCGTSLLTNGGIADDLRRLLNRHANASRWADLPEAEAQTLREHLQARRELLLAADQQQVRRLSAELNGLLGWQQRPECQSSPQDMHLLLATDTLTGMATAGMVRDWLIQQGKTAIIQSAPGLNTASLSSFRQSLSGLVRELDVQFKGFKSKGFTIHFNLTGGFKGLNGFLQALSTLYAEQAFYLFEGSSEVMLIPTLPLTLNAEQVIKDHLRAFRRLGSALPITAADAQDIPELLLFRIDDQVLLSEWGELLWLNAYRTIYREQLWPSISERVVFGSGFEASCRQRTPELLAIINDRVADLAQYTEGDCKQALKSLDPKALQGSQHQGLWECDLDPHHRIFMKKDGHVFTLEKVDKALH